MAGVEEAARVPPVLRCVYPRIATLEETITELCHAAGLRPPPLRPFSSDAVATNNNNASDFDTLLRRTFVSLPLRAPKLPPSTSFEQLSNLNEVLSRAYYLHFKAASTPNNVLCYGMRRRGPNSAAVRNGGGGLGTIFATAGANLYNPEGANNCGGGGDGGGLETADAQAAAAAERARVLAQTASLDVEVVHRSAAVDALHQPPWQGRLTLMSTSFQLNLSR